MDERSERIATAFEIPVLIAALLVIPVIAIEQSDLEEPWDTIAASLNWAIWIVFALEVVVMLLVVPNRRRWLARHPVEVAIVVLTPPFLPPSLQLARALRLFRLVRLLPLLRVLPAARRIFSLDGLRYAGLLALLTALGGGAAYASVEGKDVSTWDGVWWAVTTMTTVGYGDISPTTDAGRVVAIGVMVVGIGFIAVLTAALAQRFVATEVETEIEQVEYEVEQVEEDILVELEAITARLHELHAMVRGRRR